jgi:hypothetical protein
MQVRQHSFINAVLIMTLLNLLIACGSDDDDDAMAQLPGNDSEQEESTDCPVASDFNTRLSENLLIAGKKCVGGETTTVISSNGEMQIFICQSEQWLVTFDYINTCTPEGLCTEVGVFPVVANLEPNSNSEAPEECFFNFIPVSPVSPQQLPYIEQYQVRFIQDQEPIVIPR